MNRDDILNSEKSHDTEEFLDRYFSEPIAIFFTHIFIKLGIVPNVVTILSGLCGMAGGVFLYFRDFRMNVIGVLLEVLANVFDASDGQVARLTDHCSKFGRILDGICDSLCFVSIYLGLSFRLMNEPIPFTDGMVWGFWIWPVAAVSALCHQTQSSMADYFRNAHIYFLKGSDRSDFDRSAKLKAEIDGMKGFSFGKMYRKSYLSYTMKQEKGTPEFQKLFAELEKRGEVSEEVRESFVTKSRKYVRFPKLLAYHPKAIVLYASVLSGLHVWFFPAIIVVFGLIDMVMVRKYEGVARRVREEFFAF